MVSEETGQEDKRLREELRHIDLEKLKKVIKRVVAISTIKKKPRNEDSR